jgi:hypothetical protein
VSDSDSSALSSGLGGSAFDLTRARFLISAADCVLRSCIDGSGFEEIGDRDEYGGGEECFEKEDVEVAEFSGEGILSDGTLRGAGLSCEDRDKDPEDLGVGTGERCSSGSVLDLAIPMGGSGGGAYGDGNHVVHGRSASRAVPGLPGDGSGVPTLEPPRCMISEGAEFRVVLLELCP